jgi:hypothetical protein
MRELAGLRYTREMAGRIMEDLDPFGWARCCLIPLLIQERRQGRCCQCSAGHAVNKRVCNFLYFSDVARHTIFR